MIPDDVLTRTLLVLLGCSVVFLLGVVAVVFTSGRAGRRDDAASGTALGLTADPVGHVDLTPGDVDRLIEQLDALDAGLRHYPCRPDQACDLHDPGVCAVTRCCPSCKENPVRRAGR